VLEALELLEFDSSISRTIILNSSSCLVYKWTNILRPFPKLKGKMKFFVVEVNILQKWIEAWG